MLNFKVSTVLIHNKSAQYEVSILERKMHFNGTTRFAVFIKYIYITYIISRRNFCYAHFVLQIFNVYMHQ